MPQKARDVKSALKTKGFQEIDDRDHIFYFLIYRGKKTHIRTKVSHGESEINDKLCGMMARQMNLTGKQFRDFVDCPLSYAGYVQILVQAQHLDPEEKPSS